VNISQLKLRSEKFGNNNDYDDDDNNNNNGRRKPYPTSAIDRQLHDICPMYYALHKLVYLQ
jgi:hypothetical protein